MGSLGDVARESDAAVEAARARLVAAVRAAHRDGMTQAEIGREIGRSQPEVSRLLHFHGTSERARALRRMRAEVVALIEEAGGSNIRVFGSVATGRDRDGSDIDLLVDLPDDVGLLSLTRLERRLERSLGVPVDLVPSGDLRIEFQQRVLAEAVAL